MFSIVFVSLQNFRLFIIKLQSMKNFKRTIGISNLYNNRTLSLEDPIIQTDKYPDSDDLSSPCRSNSDHSPLYYRSLTENLQRKRLQQCNNTPQKKEIYKDVKSIFKSCRGDRRNEMSSPEIKMSRQEKEILYLSEDLRQFSKQHKLRQKRTQIRYPKTLKRIKEKGIFLGCEVKVKSQGFELKRSKDKEQQVKGQLGYTFSKGFDRFFKRKLVKETKKCREEAFSLNLTVQNHCQNMADSLRKMENQSNYRGYNKQRMQNYMISKATKKRQCPYYVKTQLDSKIAQIKKRQTLRRAGGDDTSEIASLDYISPEASPIRYPMSKRGSAQDSSEMINTGRITISSKKSFSTKKTLQSRWKEYEQDIVQFKEICEFFHKVQSELSRYLPNNHLANRINQLISQTEYGEMIGKIYKKCRIEKDYFDAKRIVAILRKCTGILSILNYIVNIIKLSISAERRKRFKSTQENIQKYQGIVNQRSTDICKQLKQTTDQKLKKQIWTSLKGSRCQPLALNQAYIDFVSKNQDYQISGVPSIQTGNHICQILKYETMLK